MHYTLVTTDISTPLGSLAQTFCEQEIHDVRVGDQEDKMEIEHTTTWSYILLAMRDLLILCKCHDSCADAACTINSAYLVC